jgi:outer membrane protein assembly factor BamA
MKIVICHNILVSWLILFLGTGLLYAQNAPDQPKDTSAPKIDSSAQVKEAEKAPIIDSIEIVGLQQVNQQTVLNKLQSKKGEPFSPGNP